MPEEHRKKAVRLVFSYDDGNVQLEEATPVDAKPLPHHSDIREEHAGFYLELKDGGGVMLFRTAFEPRFKGDLEVFGSGEEPEMFHVKGVKRSGEFSLLVPYIRTARTVTLVEIGAHPVTDSFGAKSFQYTRKQLMTALLWEHDYGVWA